MAKQKSNSDDIEIRSAPPINPYRYLLLLLVLAYYPILFGLFTVCSLLAFILFRFAWTVRSSGFVLFFAIIFATMAVHIVVAFIAMFFISDEKDEWEIELPNKWQTGLTRMVKDVAAQGDLKLPDSIHIHATSPAHIYQDKNGDTILVLGGISVAALSENALASVTAHELAHATAGDTALARLSVRWHAIMAKLDSLQIRRGFLLWNPMAWMLRGYHLLYAAVMYADSRRREFAADQFSVQVIGKEEAAASLVLLEVLEAMPWTRMINVAENAAAMNQKVDRLFAEQVRRLKTLSDAEWGDAFRLALKRQPSWHDSHPVLTARLKALGVKQKKALTLAQDLVRDPDSPSATTLFVNWPVVEKYLTKQVMDVVTIAHAERRQACEDIAAIERHMNR